MAHDVFVSYAHLDDQPPQELEEGWITVFVQELEKILSSKIGRKPDVWMDHLLVENARVDAELGDRVRDSRTLILFMSPSYLNSDWCRKEIGNFLGLNSAHKNKESVFIVAVEETTREIWHSRLQALTPLYLYRKSKSGATERLGYPRPSNSDPEYWSQLTELAHLIKKQLELIEQTAEPITADASNQSLPATAVAVQQPENQTKTPTVWIAQPTPDLHSQWEALAASIRQRGGQVLPLGHSTYPREVINDFRMAVEKDLSQSDLLIQLLSAEAGDVAKLLQMQALAAKMQMETANVLFLQWREANIDLQVISDSKYRELLQGTIACGFEQFRQQVLEHLDKLINPPPTIAIPKPNQNALTLCITAGQKDSGLADEIAAIIRDLNHVPYPIPPIPDQDQTIEEYNAGLRSLLADVNGVILAHSKENAMWLLGQQAKVRKAFTNRLNTWGAFVDGPPPEKQKIAYDPGLMYLNCRNGLSPEPIQRFIDTLQKVHSHV